jgi:hypothetical protein
MTARERFEQALGRVRDGAFAGYGWGAAMDEALSLYAAAAAPCQECERLREACKSLLVEIKLLVDDGTLKQEHVEGNQSVREARAALAQPGPAAAPCYVVGCDRTDSHSHVEGPAKERE